MPLFDASVSHALPAPYWFIEFFKTLGFALHLIPVGLLLVGTPCLLALWLFGGVNSKRLAQRFFQQTPIFIALGINFGIVPLLFVQLGYAKAFYTSTILVAAHWLAVLPLTLAAYYASYLCASRAKKEKLFSTAFFAFVELVCFFCVGLLFTSVWILFERPYEWEALWRDSAHTFDFQTLKMTLGGFGSSSGLGLYWREPSLPFRFGGILGLSFNAVASWIVFDAFYCYRGPRRLSKEEQARLKAESQIDEDVDSDGKSSKRKAKKARKPIQENPEAYPMRVASVACALVFLGWLAIVPTLGKYATTSAAAFDGDPQWNSTLWNGLLGGAIAALVIPMLFLIIAKLRKMSGRALAIVMAICELALVGCFATMRQTLQNARLREVFDPSTLNDPSGVQTTPIFAFLGVFALVAVLIVAIVVCMASTDGKTGKKSDKKKKEKSKKDKDREDRGVDDGKDARKSKPDASDRDAGGRKGTLSVGGSKNGIRRL